MAEETSESTETSATESEETQEKTESTSLEQQEKTESSTSVDENFEPTVPEGIEIDKDSLEGYKTFAKDKGLTKETAQTVFDFMLDSRTKFDTAQKEKRASTVAKNVELIKADPEIGGQNYTTVQNAVDSITLKYGGQDFKQQINDAGFKSEPSFLRFMSNLNKVLTEDKVVTQNPTPSGSPLEKTYEQIAEQFHPQN